MTTSKVENKRIINRDFIGIVLENNNLLSYEEIDIDYPKDLIDQITEIKNDDNCTILDVQKLFFAHYQAFRSINGSTTKNYYNYLYPNEYFSTYNSYACFPVQLSGHEHLLKNLWTTPSYYDRSGAIQYFVSENDYQKCIEYNKVVYLKKASLSVCEHELSRLKNRRYCGEKNLDERIEDLENYLDALQKDKNYTFQISDLKENIDHIIQEEKEKCEEEIKKEIRRARQCFADGVIRYIYACHFDENIRKLPINCSMHSLEAIGWFNKRNSVSDDINIEIHINLGYGGSSYFYLMLYYKDIPILPYTDVMRYRWARWAEIVKYTQNYSLDRDLCWKECFNFTIDSHNLAKRDSKAFVKKYIVDEIEGAVSELQSFLHSPDENIIHYQYPDYDHSATIVWEEDISTSTYMIYDNELPDFLRIEKATGFLYFLENIRQLGELIPIIAGYANRMVDINKVLESKVENLINKISKEIDNLGETIHALEEKNRTIDAEIKNITEIFKESFEKYNSLKDDESRKQYLNEHDNFRIAREKCEASQNEKTGLGLELKKVQLRGRQKALEKCKEFKQRIDVFLHNKLASSSQNA